MSEKDIVAKNTLSPLVCTMDLQPSELPHKRIHISIDPITPILKRPSIYTYSPSSVHSCFPNIMAISSLISQREKRIVLDETKLSQVGYTMKNRKILIEWMKEFSNDHYLDHETFHLSVLLMDRFFAKSYSKGYPKSKFQYIALICLMIAIKHDEAMSITPKKMLYFVGFDESDENVDEIVALERAILLELDWCVFASTCIKAIYQIVEFCSLWDGEEKEQQLSRCFSLCNKLILYPRFYEFTLLDIALSVIQHVNLSSGLLRGNLRCVAWVEMMISNSL